MSRADLVVAVFCTAGLCGYVVLVARQGLRCESWTAARR